MASPASPSLLEHFAALRDPRQGWKILYPLRAVLMAALRGATAGAEDVVEIRRRGRLLINEISTRYRGVPGGRGRWTP